MTEELKAMRERAKARIVGYENMTNVPTDFPEYLLAWDILKVCDALAKYPELLKEMVDKHKEAYGLDIFPHSENITQESSVSNISARMGRHMCDCFKHYIRLADQELSSILGDG